jgi:NMD protein affecting ribosome stability and mRNA decay
MSGGYFEAIVQLRGENRERLRQFGASLEKRLSEKTFVSKVDEKKEGIDLYIGSSKAVVADFSNRGIKALISRKLFGKDKEGRTTYRTTFLVRL